MAGESGDSVAGYEAQLQQQISNAGEPNAANSGQHPWSNTWSTAAPWNYPTDNSIQNGVSSNAGYYYDPQKDVQASAGTHNPTDGAANVMASTTGITNTTQDYAAYSSYSSSVPPYSSSVPYGYNTQYQSCYYPQATIDYSGQQGGANQVSGAAYQPPSPFQNLGPYITHTSNTGNYYSSGYENNTYNQSYMWNGNTSGTSHAMWYPNYSSADTNLVQSSSTVPANSSHYQQQYSQYPQSYNYYNQPMPPVTDATGYGPSHTSAATSSSNIGVGSGYSYPSVQPPPPGTTSWRTDSGKSAFPLQKEVPSGGFQGQHMNQVQASVQAPAVPSPASNVGGHQSLMSTQLSSLDVNKPAENFQPSLPTSTMSDPQRVSKIHIPFPKNPRIAPGLPYSAAKGEKKTPEAGYAVRPAYVSVSIPNNDVKLSQDDAKGANKGTFPVSLRTYVERVLARCKSDAQRIASQNILKEIITKASADGTLNTKNWDLEPFFPLPTGALNLTDMDNQQEPSNLSMLLSKRSPGRRTKSRWEPVADEKAVGTVQANASPTAQAISRRSLDASRRLDENVMNFVKFVPSQLSHQSKTSRRPRKKSRFDNDTTGKEVESSSGSDKEKELTKYYASAMALANSPEEMKRREHRSKRFDRGQDSQSKLRTSSRDRVGSAHARRVSGVLQKSYDIGATQAVEDEDIDWDALTVKGTCQEVEKRYLRLTSAPDPATVRPEDVLQKALQMVQTSQKNYLYKCDQLKSIRQDLTVQRIQNDLTVQVYETHARLALQAGDLPEFNQCQSQLKRLYAEGIKGCYPEFSAYNLLSIVLHSNNKRDLLSSMASLTKEVKKDEAVKHALAVRSAVTSGNYVLFFKLYQRAPNLNSCIMDLYVERMRFEAVTCMSKAYRPTVPVKYVAQVLGFLKGRNEDDSQGKREADGSEECAEWLKMHGAALIEDTGRELQLDTKASSSMLYMPEPENAVPHGDASLAVANFLTRATQ